jgi:predicted RNA-binding protein with RPS1 domain
MSDLLQNNYLRLKRQYFDEDTGRRAAKRIDNANTPQKQKNLTFLLRHHDEQEISRPETWDRDEVDQLIHFYSIMEIAALLGLIPDPLPEDLRSMALRHLRQPAVNKYFVTNYPLLLPQLFLLRVAALLDLKEVSGSGFFSEFIQLLQLDGMVHGGDEDVDNFLWMLDGGSVDEYDIDDAIESFKTSTTFVRRLTKVRKFMTGCDSATRGCLLFLNFCRELDSFLSSNNISPWLRYESWHLYGYWFSQMQFMVGDRINGIIDKIGDWTVRQDSTSQRNKKKYVTELRAVMDRLLSGVYGQLPVLWADKDANITGEHRLETFVDVQRIYTLHIPADKIRDLIGPGGNILRSIIEQTGVKIDVDDSGKVNVVSNDGVAAAKAIQMINDLITVPEVGKTYLGKVVRLAEFGAFIEIIPGTDGLLHISEIAEHRVTNVTDELKEGDQVLVKVLDIEGDRIKLSRKAILREQRLKMTDTRAGVEGAPSIQTSKK